ncbi:MULTISPECIES: AraC family transcriptional regulator [Paenibacillus]|uniref:AraC family transcriptional regulator n=1 Tax=Paenibacillus TaxID=44249 RepID=UPI0001AFD649|nr:MULTISPECIES: AraC family transcriptional regulator [unclassified Paenibacillus]EES71683.1 transcriptional regulator, AraC family [Paenibacillus sp. oral taxon 786 str. D14]OXL87547.1 hypothetical protein BCV73_34190 [Paenibacillus sp. SSG-1]
MEHQIFINRNELPTLLTIGIFETKQPWYHVDRILNINTMIFVLQGKVEICEEDIDYTVTKNQIFFLKNGCHQWGKKVTPPGSKWFWVSFAPSEFKHSENQLFLPKHVTVAAPEQLTHTLNKMHRIYQSAEPLYQERINGHLYGLLCDLMYQHLSANIEHRSNMIVTSIVRCLQSQLDRPFDSQAIADELNMNYTYLGRLFKSTTGTTINQYYKKLKVQKAIELMQSDSLNISQISEMLQYPNPYYFSRVFKQVTGLSPKEYRQQLYR